MEDSRTKVWHTIIFIKCLDIVFLLIIYSYIQYLELCSRIVRSCMKEPHRSTALKRAQQGLKYAKWAEGKQGELSMTVVNFA